LETIVVGCREKQFFLAVKIISMKKLLFVFSLFTLFIVGCKKDNPQPTLTPASIAGVYTITALKARAGSAAQVDVYDQLTECQQNDTWDFEEDGTFLYGGVATNTCQSDDYSGTWSLDGNIFSVTAQQNTTPYKLESFNGQVLVLSTSGTVNNDAATYYVTYTKQ
jgi:hypothetical protein